MDSAVAVYSYGSDEQMLRKIDQRFEADLDIVDRHSVPMYAADQFLN